MKTELIKITLLWLVLLLALSCKKEDETKDKGNTEISIGILLPKTGAAASTGESSEIAIEFAMQDIQ